MDKEEQIASMQRKLEDLDLIYQYLTCPRAFVSTLKPL